MKKFLLASLLALLSLCSNAYEYFKEGGINYRIIRDNAVEVAPDKEYTGDIVIPKSVTYNNKEYNVTRIGDYAFRNCRGLTSIDIPEGVRDIGSGAFQYCI